MNKNLKTFTIGIIFYLGSVVIVSLGLQSRSNLLIGLSGLSSVIGICLMIKALSSFPKLQEDKEYYLKNIFIDLENQKANVLLSFDADAENQARQQDYFRDVKFFDKLPESLDIGGTYVAKIFPASIDVAGSSILPGKELWFEGGIVLIKKDDLARFDKLKKTTEAILAEQSLKFMQEFPG